MSDYVLGAAADHLLLGGKAAALAELERRGLPVPAWFAVSPDAAGPDGVMRPEAADEIRSALVALGEGPFAVRSSAAGEDGAVLSFAGQLESYLGVSADDVPARIADVWRSGRSERVVRYRAENGLTGPPPIPGVLVQPMISASRAGVAFAADPVTGRTGICVVSAVLGLGEGLVSGDVDADTWHVARNGEIVQRHIARKDTERIAAVLGGTSDLRVTDARADSPALTDDEVLRVAGLARRTSREFGRYQDIEWAFSGDVLWLLQSRPITSLARVADPDGELNIWDNSNIAESYGGITTPMTFSFARRAYEEVYRQLHLILGVPRRRVAANASTYRRMLGLIEGRVYYNLLSWYRVLADLPGYKMNRSFMESMMGVREPLPDELVAEIGESTRRERFFDTLAFGRSMAGLLRANATLDRRIEAFYSRLDEVLTHPDLTTLRLDELAAVYRTMESRLLTRWDAPLVNDFFAMFFYGLLRSLATRWSPETPNLANDLLVGEGGIISAEPATRIVELARLAVDDERLVDALAAGSISEVRTAMPEGSAFSERLSAYLDRFGNRCLDELKLESPTLVDDPLPLYRSIGHMAVRLREGHEPAAVGTDGRAAAEACVDKFPAHKRTIFRWVLANARKRVRDRENLRFERTRLFGTVRALLVEMGARLASYGVLHEPRDVFWLEVEEVLGFAEGTATTPALDALVTTRRTVFLGYAEYPAPPSRFETRGAPYAGNSFVAPVTMPISVEGECLTGLGCCPGIVEGVARVVTDPRGVELHPGEILVAERTDPGWVMLFPSAAGIVVERGSLLSHSAIVSREMGIPCVVGVTGVTAWIADGERIKMNGSMGTVERVSVPEVRDAE